MTAYTTRDIKVYDCYTDKSISVQEDGAGTSSVCVKCITDYYGKLDFSLGVEAAEALAKAILEQCKYIKERQ